MLFFPLLTLGIAVFRYFLILALESLGFAFNSENDRSRGFFILAVFFPLIVTIALGWLLPEADTGLGNRLLHAFWGGGTVAILLESVLCRMKSSIRPLGMLFLLLSAVSIAGVANELLEFALDSAGFGMFSASRTDTWLDLLSNTVGACVSWAVIRLGSLAFSRK